MFEHFIRRGRPRSGTGAGDDAALEVGEVIDYPPPARGLPRVGLDRLLEKQLPLLKDLRQALPLSDGDFDGLFMPVVRRVAGFVHLLPASENHHHSKAGGLLRHSLEVARWAAQFSNPVTFEPFGDPLVRLQREPRWHVAAGLAGLLHDVGKPVTDLDVVARDGTRQWNKIQLLLDWLQAEGVERYVITWRQNRHGSHEVHAPGLARLLITDDLARWLLDVGPDIITSLMEALGKGAPANRLSELWKHADRTSVDRDMRLAGILARDAGVGIALHTYLIEVIQELVQDRRWKVNEPGGPVWYLHDENGEVALFIVWRKAIVQDAVETLRGRRVPGVSDDPHRLAKILLERGAALPFQGHDFWPISPDCLARKHGKRQFLLALRISDPALVFRDATTPTTVAALFGEEPQEATPAAAPPPAPPPGDKLPVEPPDLQEWEPTLEEPAVATDGPPIHEHSGSRPPGRRRPEGGEKTPSEVSNADPQQGRRRSEPKARPDSARGGEQRGKARERQGPLASEVARNELAQLGPAGHALLRILDAAGANSLFLRTGKGLLLRWDERLDALVDRDRLQADLAKSSAVQVDAMAPFRLVREIDGVPGVVFSATVGQSISMLLEAPARPADGPGNAPENSARRDASPQPVEASTRTSGPDAGAPERDRFPATATKPATAPGREADVARIVGWMRERPDVRGVSDVVAGLNGHLSISSVRALRILQSEACFRIVEGRVEVVESGDGGKV